MHDNLRNRSAFQLLVNREALNEKDGNKSERMLGYGTKGYVGERMMNVSNGTSGRTRGPSWVSTGGVENIAGGDNCVIVVNDVGGGGGGGGVVCKR